MSEKITKTFKDFDQLGFGDFSKNLTSFIETERRFIEGALLISLNGKFGSGKSTFFEMWRAELESEEPRRFSTIVLNAWDADFERDALLSIISAFVRHFESQGNESDIESLKEIGGKLGKFGLAIGNQIVAKVTGVDFQAAQEKAEPRKPGVFARECFDRYVDRQKAFENLKSILREMIAEAGTPILVMVDELDRCRPDYAVEYLETIKHIFDLKELVFVLGIDKATLKSSVSALFGGGLDFNEYYRKFVHRNISLPQPYVEDRQGLNRINTQRFVRTLISSYLTDKSLQSDGRFCYAEWDLNNIENLATLLISLKLSPRQIHEVFRLLAHALIIENSEQKLRWPWQTGFCFMASLSVGREKLYSDIGQGNALADDLISFVDQISVGWTSQASKFYWWATFLLAGSISHKDLNLKLIKSHFAQKGILEEDYEEEAINKDIGSMAAEFRRFGEDRKPFQEIFETLEHVKSFGS